MTSKERAKLKSLAMKEQPILSVGKSGVTPELCTSCEEALAKRELIKLSVLKNCEDDPKIVARMLSERTRSELVQVSGRKIFLYKQNKEKPVIIL